MSKEINDASDKLNLIDDKIGFLANVIMFVNLNNYHFNENDLTGLSLILNDLQDEIKKVKELLD